MKMNRLQLYAKAWMGLINILLIDPFPRSKCNFPKSTFPCKPVKWPKRVEEEIT